MDSDVSNIYSIWTKKKPCDNIYLSTREFINLSATDEGTNHIIRCHDCSNRYSMTSRILIEAHKG